MGADGSLSFRLVRQGASDSYALEKGCFVGEVQALGGIGGDHPFVALLDGTLSCKDGVLSGEMSGYYNLFGQADIRYEFEGPLTGTYAGDTQEFSGTWVVDEGQLVANPPGGDGEWAASYAGPTGLAVPAECEALRNAAADP